MYYPGTPMPKIASVLALLLAGSGLAAAAPPGGTGDFDACLQELRRHAAEQGVSPATRERVFSAIEQQPRVLELDAKQPEFFRTFWQYLQGRVTEQRVEQGRRLLAEHRPLLQRISRQYGVGPEYLLAFWGLETNYGNYLGGTRVVNALATLACDPRRAEFFRGELIQALHIVEGEGLELSRMIGSWAGAMGHTQFMPSTFTRYAVDYDGDGQRDLWGSLPDALASAANYLRAEGWQDGERWGREVQVPNGFDWRLATLDQPRPLREWRQLGLRRADGGPLPVADMQAALILPQGHQGPAFLVYHNFRVMMRWNASVNYALAVGHLADRIAGMGGLEAEPAGEQRPLRRAEVEEIQRRLTAAGFDAGPVDGIVGSRTRDAARAFQAAAGLPADGYPDHALLQRLRQQP